MQHLFAAWIDPETARGYTAGLIILAAAPCTAMVFVWSYLTDGDPAYTLVQVAVNDLIMLVAFAPIVMFLCGVAHVVVPAKVLITSVVVFIVVPLTAGWLTRTALLKSHGKEWFEQKFLPKFHPVMIGALLLTLVLIFAFQSKNLTSRWVAVLLIAVPIILQVYFNSGLTYLLMRWLRVEHNVAAPGALIGASNFFELAVAVAITLFGADSPAALATVVGVLVEVPVMLSVCNVCNRTRGWYQSAEGLRRGSRKALRMKSANSLPHGLTSISQLAKFVILNGMTTNDKARYNAQARVHKALAHPTRLFIVEELSRRERCVCELTEMIGAEMPTVSRHLSVLKGAGILEDDKRGAQVFYRLRLLVS